MRIFLIAIGFALLASGLAACGVESEPADPNSLLPPGDRPARGAGLFSGEDGVLTIPLE